LPKELAMASDLSAGLIIGLFAALPYLAFLAAGLVGLLRGERLSAVKALLHISGAALGAIAAGVALAYLLFFVLRWTGLSQEPSGFWWGVGLALPALVAGLVGFLGTAHDEKHHRFHYLFAGVFLVMFGFCGLPVGVVVLLAGLIFGHRVTAPVE
jgi:hypothetical protein